MCLVAIPFLQGCIGTRYAAGVRVTPGAEHPVEPEVSFGVHPAAWVPKLADRRWDAGVGLTTSAPYGRGIGLYAEGTGVVAQTRTGIADPLRDAGSHKQFLDRTSAGGALIWNVQKDPTPAVEALVANDAGTFYRQMSSSEGGVWGQATLGLYLGATYARKGKWSFSAGAKLQTPVVAITKL